MTQLLLPEPKELWAPKFFTPASGDRTRGPEVSLFAENFLTATRGFKKGLPLEFTDWQKWVIDRVLEENPETGLLNKRRALIGLPRKNGKSLLGTTLALQHLMFGGAGIQVYSVARDRQQALIVFKEAKDQVKASPILSKYIRATDKVLVNKRTGAEYRAIAADGMGANGFAPSLVIADELHAWRTTKAKDLWDAMNEGSGDRPESMVVAITTAGANKTELLGSLYEHGKKVATGAIDDPSFGFYWWEADEHDDPLDPKTWYKANPNLAEGLLDESDFSSSLKLSGSTSFASFLRYRLNMWVKVNGEDFVSEFHWNNAFDPDGDIPLGAKVVCGFDGSLSGDSCGFVIMDVETGIFKVYRVWENDGSPDWYVDREEVVAAYSNLRNEYDCVMTFCDSSYYEQDVMKWAQDFPGTVMKIPQTASRIVPMAQQFQQDLVGQLIHHIGEEVLTRHVRNAVITENGSYSKEKRNSPNKIDLLVCLVLANAARNRYIEQEEAGSSMLIFN